MISSPSLRPLGDFDIGGAGDAGLDFAESALSPLIDEHALNFFLPGLLRGRIGGARLVLRALLRRLQIALLADGERLNRNGQRRSGGWR